MTKMGSLITPASKTDSIKRWKDILQSRKNRTDDTAMNLDARYGRGIGSIIMNLAALEIDGGECTRCRKPWNKVKIDSFFYKGFYHVPSCECDCVCPVCGSTLQVEQHTYELKNNDWLCPHCGYALAEFDESGQMIGKRYGHYIKNNKNMLRENMVKRGDFLESKFGKDAIKEIQEKTGKEFYLWVIFNGLILDPPIHGEIV